MCFTGEGGRIGLKKQRKDNEKRLRYEKGDTADKTTKKRSRKIKVAEKKGRKDKGRAIRGGEEDST